MNQSIIVQSSPRGMGLCRPKVDQARPLLPASCRACFRPRRARRLPALDQCRAANSTVDHATVRSVPCSVHSLPEARAGRAALTPHQRRLGGCRGKPRLSIAASATSSSAPASSRPPSSRRASAASPRPRPRPPRRRRPSRRPFCSRALRRTSAPSWSTPRSPP